MFKLVFSILLFHFTGLLSNTVLAGQVYKNNTWYKHNKSNTVIIYVHGIFSNSNDCWTSANGVYWPSIVNKDKRLDNPSIFLGGYYTDFSSGIYRVSDAADQLRSHLVNDGADGTPAPINKNNIIFIAHSTGGLVARYLVERHKELFKGKRLGFVLLASPSRGSGWANRLGWLHEFFGNKMAGQLQRDNDFIDDLDQRFADLVSLKKLPYLVGVDLFENKFIIPGLIWNNEHVVKAKDAASYFGAYKIVPKTDHFTIAKPDSISHQSHQLLVDFYTTRFLPNMANKDKQTGENAKLIFPDTFIEQGKRIFPIEKGKGTKKFPILYSGDRPVTVWPENFPNGFRHIPVNKQWKIKNGEFDVDILVLDQEKTTDEFDFKIKTSNNNEYDVSIRMIGDNNIKKTNYFVPRDKFLSRINNGKLDYSKETISHLILRTSKKFAYKQAYEVINSEYPSARKSAKNIMTAHLLSSFYLTDAALLAFNEAEKINPALKPDKEFQFDKAVVAYAGEERFNEAFKDYISVSNNKVSLGEINSRLKIIGSYLAQNNPELYTSSPINDKKINVAFHIDAGDGKSFKRSLKNIGNHVNSIGENEANRVVVFHENAVKWAAADMSEDQTIAKTIANLKKSGVKFNISANLLKKAGKENNRIITVNENIDIIPSGVAEVAHQQSKGYMYVKP